MASKDAVLPRVGERVEATRTISWTIDEFQDYPLVVQLGDRGIVTEVNHRTKHIWVKWDDDKFKHMRKCLFLEGASESWPIKVLR